MVVLLLIVTCASLCLSAGLLWHVLRLTRRERDRSEARAAALAETLAIYGLEDTARPAHSIAPLDEAPLEFPEAPRVDALATFDQTPAAAARGRWFPRRLRMPPGATVPAVGLAAVAIFLALTYVISRPARPITALSRTATSGGALELVSLRHARQGEGLMITGVVRNPPEGRAISRVAAVAFLFDRQGNYLTSGRSLLDYTQLQPGEESPFSIAVPSAASVGRYRITFRTDDAIVPHVDRRSDPPPMPAASR